MPRAAKSTPKRKLNRSQAIRDYLAANPGASPRAIKSALKAKGIVVTTSLVGAIKYRRHAPGRPEGRRRGRPVGRPSAAAKNDHLRVEDLLAAKAFVDRVGGMAAARSAIEVLAQLS